jgi:hypothetical protein
MSNAPSDRRCGRGADDRCHAIVEKNRRKHSEASVARILDQGCRRVVGVAGFLARLWYEWAGMA